MFADDAGLFLAELGDPVQWAPSNGAAAVSGRMVFDQPDDLIDGGDVQSRQYLLTFERAAWPGLKRGEQLVISGSGGGATYRLRTDPRQVDDGVFCTVYVSRT